MVKIMKLIVMFDLPTGTKAERKSYATFRKYLVEEGFSMLQYSVYAKTCGGIPAVNALEERLKGNLPKTGSVTSFVMTDKEFSKRRILVSHPDSKQQVEEKHQLTLFF